MGASGWRYIVPYEADLQGALARLREETFRSGDYLWAWEGEQPRPQTLEELIADEATQEEGTHSIIDCSRIVSRLPTSDMEWATEAYFGTIVPVTGDELLATIGTESPTIDHVEALDEHIDCARWVGRCAILYSAVGNPTQIAFWGYSGD